MIAVDACVAIKWLLPEQGSDEARRLLTQGDRLIAPSLATVEVLGAISRKYRENAITDQHAHSLRTGWERMLARGDLVLQETESVLEKAFNLSLTIKHALADCTYLALAMDSGADLVTADSAFAKNGGTVYTRIRLLPRPA
jgi:predicted nucleic acid-binding protein